MTEEQPNLDYIKALSGGDLGFEKKLIEIIKEEFPKEILLYHNLITKSNTQEAASCVHKIKHKISILGLSKSYKLAVVYEEKLKVGNMEMRSEFEKILSTISNFLLKI